MNRGERHHAVQGFTLTDLAAVLCSVGLLAILSIPVACSRDGAGNPFAAIGNAKLKAKLTGTLSNGKNLYKLMFSEIEMPGLNRGPGARWPASSPDTAAGEKIFTSSTEYFADLMSSNVITDISYPFFAEGDITKAQTEAQFRDQSTLHNAWCIALDMDDRTRMGAPALFTQNMRFSNPSRPRVDQLDGLAADAPPYGDRSGIVIQRGGAGMILDKETCILTNFNSAGATNAFLWPLASGQALSP